MTYHYSAIIFSILLAILISFRKPKKSSGIEFGYVDSNGKFHEGYVENGEMKYKDVEPIVEKIGIINFKYIKSVSSIFSNHCQQNTIEESLVVYREKDGHSGNVLRIWAESPTRGNLEFDVWAWENHNRRVLINDPYRPTLEEALGWR